MPEQPMIPLADAEKAVNDMTRRVALLYLSFARTLVDTFGEEEGRAQGARREHPVAQQRAHPRQRAVDLGLVHDPVGGARAAAPHVLDDHRLGEPW